MASAPAAEQLLTFRVGSKRFAVAAPSVREVVRPARATRVPHAPDSLIGLVNLRGTVLPLVALGALIGRDVTNAGRVIVLERADPVGLLVDEVSSVVDSADADAALIDLEPLLGEAFETAAPARRAARLGALAAIERAAPAEEVLLLAFLVGGQEYALPIDQIEEVMRLPEGVTSLPMAEAVALGTVAWRGGLLPLLSLRLLLDLAPAPGVGRAQVLIVRIGRHKVGLVVDGVNAILRVPEDEIDPVPAVLSRGKAEARIQAISRLDGGARLVSVLATDHLVRADLTSLLLQDATIEGEEMASERAEAVTEQFLIFRVGEQDFGMPIAAVREVTHLPDKLTRLPRTPAFVEGVINLRGTVVPVIDQGRRFGSGAVTGTRRRVIIAALGNTEAGFLVDSVAEVLRVPAEAIGPAPELRDERTRVFDRVANLEGEGRMILIVEPQELLDRAERDLLAAMTAAS